MRSFLFIEMSGSCRGATLLSSTGVCGQQGTCRRVTRKISLNSCHCEEGEARRSNLLKRLLRSFALARNDTILVFSFLFLTLSFSLPCYAASNYVRVAIIQDAASLRLKINGPSEVVDFKSKKVLYRAKNLNTTVTAYKGGISMGNSACRSANILIKVDDNTDIIVNDRKFRGNIQLLRQPNMRLLVVNWIELEDYVKGILYHEVSHYWPMEVLEAQAIVCRSYALYQKEQMIGKDYDLTADIYSQVYGGKTSERYRINKAVDETKGLILKYNNKVLPAFFHAACGGHTEDGAVLWNVNIQPLKGVVCNYCPGSPHYNWHYVVSLKELEQKLAEGGHKISGIKNIEILDKNPSGRVSNLKITGATKELKISAKDLRSIMDPNVIRSTNFNIAIFADDIVFEGLGWGHGVGFCQWGGYFMAKQGFSYQDILKFYYPGAQITSLNN